jgi:hypothetical protein
MKDLHNCWEYRECGRQPGGRHVGSLGTCPAATHTQTDGVNHGTNGGRVCWAIAGTLCGGRVQGTGATKLGDCLHCSFYGRVASAESTLTLIP